MNDPKRLAMFFALLAWAPVEAPAQGTARSMDIDTSIRAAGMGGTSAGVTWGDPNVWGNVATLGGVSGVRWEHGRTQLVPGLATDVFLESDRLIVGGGGLAFCFSGKPANLGGVRLDYGISEQTDVGGTVIGVFDSYEEVRGMGFAVSVPRIVDEVLVWRGHDSRLADAFDLSGGMFLKHTRVQLAPSSLSGVAEADTRDWGIQGRISPLELLPRQPGREWGAREVVLLDIGYGRSVLNYNDARFVFLSSPGSSPTRMQRSGIAFRAGMKLPPARGDRWTDRMLRGFSPLLAFGYARDHDANDAGGTGQGAYEVDQSGFEVSVANVLTLRHGHWADLLGDIDGATTGWGLGLPLGPWAGFRFDKATVPQARNSSLPDVTRRGWSAWVDPARIARDLRTGSHAAGSAR